MNASHTTALTFEQFAAHNNIPTQYLESARFVFDLEQRADADRPTTVQPCPAWCAEPADHPFDMHLGQGDSIEHTRVHSHTLGKVTVVQDEHSLDGVVTRVPASVFIPDRVESLSAEQAREIASDLMLAADLLDDLG